MSSPGSKSDLIIQVVDHMAIASAAFLVPQLLYDHDMSVFCTRLSEHSFFANASFFFLTLFLYLRGRRMIFGRLSNVSEVSTGTLALVQLDALVIQVILSNLCDLGSLLSLSFYATILYDFVRCLPWVFALHFVLSLQSAVKQFFLWTPDPHPDRLPKFVFLHIAFILFSLLIYSQTHASEFFVVAIQCELLFLRCFVESILSFILLIYRVRSALDPQQMLKADFMLTGVGCIFCGVFDLCSPFIARKLFVVRPIAVLYLKWVASRDMKKFYSGEMSRFKTVESDLPCCLCGLRISGAGVVFLPRKPQHLLAHKTCFLGELVCMSQKERGALLKEGAALRRQDLPLSEAMQRDLMDIIERVLGRAANAAQLGPAGVSGVGKFETVAQVAVDIEPGPEGERREGGGVVEISHRERQFVRRVWLEEAFEVGEEGEADSGEEDYDGEELLVAMDGTGHG
jgi:hypothetical protein